MSKETKQTALQWYVERLYDLEIAYNQGLIMTNTYIKGKREAIEQAKEMEKEQIEEAFSKGVDDEYEYHINNLPRKHTETYYNETYGGNK